MFDLWGGITSVPLPSLELETIEVPVTEKLAWEKELMGVYLSEHPFSSFANRIASENTTLCGQIDAELAGQTVIVAGMLVSVRYLFTKDGRPFASATLEDLEGRVEVMVWPKVYAETRDLWQEGNILLVEGTVRLRDERVQLNCDRVRLYQPEGAEVETVVTSQPVEATIGTEEAIVSKAVVKSHRLVISLNQTSDEETDIAYLQKLINTLKEFPGQDEVNLRVASEEKVINLRLSNMYTGYCSELHQRLVELVGEDGLRLELADLKES
jgi:DNA polymerase-3 subunit alpha